MRTGAIIALTLLLIIGIGGYTAQESIEYITMIYESAAEELHVMTGAGMWQRAEETLRSYQAQWQRTQRGLKLFVKHAVVQEITMAMDRLMVGIQQQDTALCAMSCVELKQQAQLLQEQETISWTNLL